MLPQRRIFLLLALFTLSFVLWLSYRSQIHEASWLEIQHHLGQRIGMGEWGNHPSNNETLRQLIHAKPQFRPGQAKPPGSNYTKLLVVPRTTTEDIEWMDEFIPNIERAIYVADDPKAPLHPPKNKGHEVMIYLTYIIDHYDSLPDVLIFMHSHRIAWHNSDLFGYDAAEMLNRLSPERVTREGYMNMRCQWYPGCPDWMMPGETEFDEQKTEQILIAKAWAELFPLENVPEVLATPCCAQFALSRERVRQIPLEKYRYYREWLLSTPLQDFVSGRVWEYMWQYVFTGESYWCPSESACYCDGFGACFGGPDQYRSWWEKKGELLDASNELNEWQKKGEDIQAAIDEGRPADAAAMERPQKGADIRLKRKMDRIQKELDELLRIALERGEDPKNRAMEAGREWHEGDGF